MARITVKIPIRYKMVLIESVHIVNSDLTDFMDMDLLDKNKMILNAVENILQFPTFIYDIQSSRKHSHVYLR